VSVHIRCDSAEIRSGIPERLERRGCEIEIARLEVGDYELSSRLCVERKGALDFANSVVSGRLLEQMTRLASAYERPVLLIEGVAWDGDRRLRAPMLGRLYRHLAALSCQVWVSPTPARTAAVLLDMARAERDGSDTTPLVAPPARSSRALTPPEIFCVLPGVGPASALRLAGQFTSLRELCQADQESIQAVIGPRRGKRLYDVFSAQSPTSRATVL
jgi:ERCC4-type nuclease